MSQELPPSSSLSRRDAVKLIGTGLAAASLGVPLMKAGTPGPLEQPFTLPQLGYSYAALEPHIDAQTMEIHYTKHHQAYINNANKALEAHPALLNMNAEEIVKNLGKIPEPVRGTLRNNVGGHLNHTFFWKIIGPKGGGAPEGALGTQIAQTFGSFDAFKAKFAEQAMGRFGSGWAWLVYTKDKRLAVISTGNQDSPLTDGHTPIVGLDVWEHAYYLHYQNKRADYVNAFWSVVDWNQASVNLTMASAA